MQFVIDVTFQMMRWNKSLAVSHSIRGSGWMVNASLLWIWTVQVQALARALHCVLKGKTLYSHSALNAQSGGEWGMRDFTRYQDQCFSLQDWDFLSLWIASDQGQDPYRVYKKLRLHWRDVWDCNRDPWNLMKILWDPNFFRDYSPPLVPLSIQMYK